MLAWQVSQKHANRRRHGTRSSSRMCVPANQAAVPAPSLAASLLARQMSMVRQRLSKTIQHLLIKATKIAQLRLKVWWCYMRFGTTGERSSSPTTGTEAKGRCI